jgi:hypothetical protein
MFMETAHLSYCILKSPYNQPTRLRGPLFAQSVHVSRNSLWSLMREELRYCVASLASPNTRNRVAVLLRFAEHRMPEKPLADGFCYSAGDVMLHLGGSGEGAIPRA